MSGKQSLFHFPAEGANHDIKTALSELLIPFRISSELRNTHTIFHRKYIFGNFTYRWKKYIPSIKFTLLAVAIRSKAADLKIPTEL